MSGSGERTLRYQYSDRPFERSCQGYVTWNVKDFPSGTRGVRVP